MRNWQKTPGTYIFDSPGTRPTFRDLDQDQDRCQDRDLEDYDPC